MDTPKDLGKELLQGCILGKKTAWDYLVKKYTNLIYSSIHHCLKTHNFPYSNEDIKDIYNSIFLFLVENDYKKLRQFKGEKGSSLSTWLWVIYREIIKGASVGEALKEARLRFIKRYGEENILWACYMLYGDPTYRLIDAKAVYVEGEEYASEGKKREEEKETKPIQASPIGERAKRKSFPWFFPLFSILVITAILAIIAIKIDLKEFISKPSVRKEIVVEDKEKRERIDTMIALLTKRYEEQQKAQKLELEKDPWTSKPLTMTLMDFKNKGRIPQNDTTGDYILSLLTKSLQSSRRVHILERKKLEDLLEELKLSSSELADHELALVLLGKILGARLISVGEMIEYKGGYQINLRISETETSAIKITADRNGFDKSALDEMVQGLVQEILDKAKEAYPLKGRIASMDGNKIVINIGSREGVRLGLVMKILGHEKPIEMYGKIIGYGDKEIGKLRITDIRDQISFGEIIFNTNCFLNFLKMRNLLNSTKTGQDRIEEVE